MRILLALASTLAFAASAQAVTIVNGSFESGVSLGETGQVTLAGGDTTSITGWTVFPAGVDYVSSSVWAAANGSRSVDLSALDAGGIGQRITDLIVGQTYRINFDLSANPNDPALRPKDKRMQVLVSGHTPGMFTYTLTDANAANNMLYQLEHYTFVATGTSMNIAFQSLVRDQYGPVLDNVSISVVPEAATWAMLIAGFGMVGVATRRRRQPPVVTA